MSTPRQPRRPAWSTLAAALLAALVTIPFFDVGLDAARVAWGSGSVDVDSVTAMNDLGIPGADRGGMIGLMAVVAILASTWVAVMALGLLARRTWARYGAILTFTLFAMMLVPLTLVGLSRPDAPNAPQGVAVAAAEVAVIGLLLLRRTADDIADAEWGRDRRRATRGDEGLIRRFRDWLAGVSPDEFGTDQATGD